MGQKAHGDATFICAVHVGLFPSSCDRPGYLTDVHSLQSDVP